MLKLGGLNVTLGIGTAGEAKCHTLPLGSTLGDGFDESSIHMSRDKFTVMIMKLNL